MPSELIQPQEERLHQLTAYFSSISSGQLTPESTEYIRQGGSLRLCLSEIIQLSEVGAEEKALNGSREEYMRLLMKPSMPFKSARQPKRVAARESYIDGVVDKIARVVDAKTPEDAISLHQMPTIIEGANFKDGKAITLESLAANQLYIIIDTALCEHADRRSLIHQIGEERPVRHLLGNRVLKMALAAGVFAISISPDLHFIPINNTGVTDNVQLGLEVFSGGIFAYEAPEEIRWRYLDVIHNKRTKKLHEQLAESRQLSDLALRMVYSSTRYGDEKVAGLVTGRSGTDDKAENLRRFSHMDKEFQHMNNDPGGKPYTGNQALGYSARLLIERRKQLEGILDSTISSEEKRGLYLKLARDIIVEDVDRMEKGLSASKIRRGLLFGASAVAAAFIPDFLSAADGGIGLSEDLQELPNRSLDDASEEA